VNRKILTLSIAAILAGCTTMTSQTETPMEMASTEMPTQIVEPTAVSQAEPKPFCQSTQRDLTVSWLARWYWCGGDRKHSVSENDGAKSVEIAETKYPPGNKSVVRYAALSTVPYQYHHLGPDAAALVESREETIETDIEPESPKLADRIVGKTVASFTQLVEAASRLPVNITFAKNLRVLGPKGRAATESLIDQVKSSDRVKLRGLLLPDEAKTDSATYREILSVGRALAVRKHWRNQGLDTSHIKILHHDPNKHGRVVEVYIDA